MGFEAMLLKFRVARQLEIDFVAPLSSYGLPDPDRRRSVSGASAPHLAPPVNAQLKSATGARKARAKTRASVGEPLLPSSSDGNRKPPAISDRHKAEPKAEKRANRHSRGGRNMKHLSDHHDGSASEGSNGVKVCA